jgi:hypothetical protein
MDLVRGLKERNIMETEEFDINQIWDNPVPKVQHRIIKELSILVEADLYNSLPLGNPSFGINAHDSLSVNDKAIRIQGLVNKDTTVSAFLLANPSFYCNKIRDNAFVYSIRTRMLRSVVGSRKFCICGKPMDLFAHHTGCCTSSTLRNKSKNTIHAVVNRAIKHCIMDCTRDIEEISVLRSEPFVHEFFPSRVPDGRSKKSNLSSKRLDIAVINGLDSSKSILIDTTLVSCMQKSIKSYDKCGDVALFGQERKEKTYSKYFDVSNNKLGMVHFFAVEANGCIALSSRKDVCKHFSCMSNEEFPIALSRFYQKVSVAFQKCRAVQISNTVNFYSVDKKSSCPYVNGDLPDVDPPAYFLYEQ